MLETLDRLLSIDRKNGSGLIDQVLVIGAGSDKNLVNGDGFGRETRSETLEVLSRDNDWLQHLEERAQQIESSSVLLFRLEKTGTPDGNVETIAEIGIALANALLKGQKVIVSIDPDFANSVEAGYARSQYQSFEVLLEQFSKHFPQYLTIHRNNGEIDLGATVSRITSEQRDAQTQSKVFEMTSHQRVPLADVVRPWVVVTGSGKSDAEAFNPGLQRERDAIKGTVNASRDDVLLSVLTEGAQAAAWDKAHELEGNPEAQKYVFDSLSRSEMDRKLGADLLLVPIHNEATSISGTTEVIWYVINAIVTDQDLALLLEDFSALAHFQQKVRDAATEAQKKKSPQVFLTGLGIDANALNQEPKALVIIEKILQFRPVEWADIQNIDCLRSSGMFRRTQQAENVRKMIQFWIQRLLPQIEKLGCDRISYTTDVTEYTQQIASRLKPAVVATEKSVKAEPVFVQPQLHTASSNMAEELSKLLTSVESQSPLITAGGLQIGRLLARKLGIAEDKIVTKFADTWVGPNTMGHDASEMTIILRGENNRELELLRVESNSYSRQPEQAVYTVDCGQLETAIRRKNMDRMPQQSANVNYDSGSSFWWKD